MLYLLNKVNSYLKFNVFVNVKNIYKIQET